MKKAWLLISSELLIDALRLPGSTEILDAKSDDMYPPHVIKLLITHSDLPECEPGEEPIDVKAILYSQEPIVFDGWRWADDGKS